MNYADVTYANDYFENVLFGRVWNDHNPLDKERALNEATRLIDSLDYIGHKADSSQENQFPRGHQENVPENIKKAACEIALGFLEQGAVDTADDLRVSSQAYSTVRVTYDTDYLPVFNIAGVPSRKAWDYLLPFLRDERRVRVHRA